jgi:UTP-glucose-1-phosphate uridylyltransferase
MYALRWRATRYDIGNRTDYVKCIAELGLRDPQSGVELRSWLRRFTQ